MWTIAVSTWVVIVPIIGSVLGALVAGGAVAFYLAKPNKDKIAAETAAIEATARDAAVDSVTKALDRQDKTIERLETQAKADAKIIATFNTTVAELADRVTFLEGALTAAGAAAHIASSEAEAEAAIAAGRIVILKRELGERAGTAGEGGNG